MQTEVFETKPEEFQGAVEAAAAYVEIEGRLLILQNADFKEEAGRWGVPAGKVETGESPEEAVRRELFEETGISVEPSALQSLGSLYIRKPHVQYVYHLFRIDLDQKPDVRLSKEHVQAHWATSRELKSMPLMEGAFEALCKYRTALAQKKITASVNVYLILKQEGRVLLALRQNTGYLDEHWGFPAGHVEKGEAATAGMVREAKEELGIDILPEDLKTVHVMHCQTNRLNIDIFFECSRWEGEIRNNEPHKCAEVRFFDPKALPAAIVESNAFVLEAAFQGQLYSEWGFL